MDKRTYRIISIFLAILLLFAGACADAAPAYALFEYDLTGKSAACLTSCHSDLNDDAISATESSNTPTIAMQSRESHQQQYREVSEFLSLQNSVFGSTSRRKSYIHHAAKYAFCLTQNELLTEYIHQSDGKKHL